MSVASAPSTPVAATRSSPIHRALDADVAELCALMAALYFVSCRVVKIQIRLNGESCSFESNPLSQPEHLSKVLSQLQY
eukprot:scaffold10288_cov80-Phaeocystis_antarctica.AAC.1